MTFEDWWDSNFDNYVGYGGIDAKAVSKAAWEASLTNTVCIPRRILELEAALAEKERELEALRKMHKIAWQNEKKLGVELEELRGKVRRLHEDILFNKIVTVKEIEDVIHTIVKHDALRAAVGQ